MYAARLAKALRDRVDVSLFGMGGPQMRAAGVDVIQDYSEVSVVGITEILGHLPSLFRAMGRLVDAARNRRPALAILTDFPGFHLRLARKLLPLGVRNVYYICPQFWAWRPWRAHIVRRRFAQALCIFPFEESFYAKAGVPVKFIGHPLVGAVQATATRAQFVQKHGLRQDFPIVTILPGSRWGEISRHLPLLVQTAGEIEKIAPAGCNFVLALAPGVDIQRLQALLPSSGYFTIVQSETYDALAAADASIVCSGTATVEAALLNAPMVVVYKVTALTALLAKPLVRTPHFAMVNLIAGHRAVPELIQDDFQPAKVAEEVLRLLRPEDAAAQRRHLAEIRARLGPAGAVERAADAIVALLRESESNAK